MPRPKWMTKALALLIVVALAVLGCGAHAAMTAKTMAEYRHWQYYSAAFNVPAGATTEVVALVTGKRIRVVGLVVVADVAGTATFKSSTTAISGVIPIAAKGGVVMPCISSESIATYGWMDTAAGEALNVTTATCTLDGVLVYAVGS